MLGNIYNLVLFQPLLNVLIFLYNIIPVKDLGWSIIIITILIRVILYPLSKSSIESQKKLQLLKPKMDELKKKHGDNKETYGRAVMELYKQEKINPASSCLPLLIQLPILIAVYQVFRNGLGHTNFELLYSFVSDPGTINYLFLGLIDLAQPNTVLAILAGLFQYWQAKMIMQLKGKEDEKEPKENSGSPLNITNAMTKQMMYFMPIFTFFIGLSLPSGLVLYWAITTVLTILQQYLVFGKKEIKA
ncbi:MAG: hypothetical protein COX77_04790 [Candidatus Komeilibacteria bacterium CG_4_10_14_0_2_um_filter_37_10]|uniref:Membrane insertase YidC/Oxa/ALB C-terminal domain-containing protein n=2 Tax=Parcubacteria group TaxID=1794811 RepID=A0A2M7VD91_9BACT|nr:MAG: hypothetical protein COX77_04790 [Candidatus Komeilibacteria bacterium CG_4_10_14_0_2_um_filter_37_10]